MLIYYSMQQYSANNSLKSEFLLCSLKNSYL